MAVDYDLKEETFVNNNINILPKHVNLMRGCYLSHEYCLYYHNVP